MAAAGTAVGRPGKLGYGMKFLFIIAGRVVRGHAPGEPAAASLKAESIAA